MKKKKDQSLFPTQFKVEFFDCWTRFLVQSQSRPNEVHLVDLETEEGHCECSCEDWTYRNKDWLAIDGTVAVYKPYECKHIKHSKDFIKRQSIMATLPTI